MPRQFIYIAFAVVAVFFGYHAYTANAERLELRDNLSAVKASLESLHRDNDKIESDIEYFEEPRNLEKEARARFNYRAPNEKLIIVVPQQD